MDFCLRVVELSNGKSYYEKSFVEGIFFYFLNVV